MKTKKGNLILVIILILISISCNKREYPDNETDPMGHLILIDTSKDGGSWWAPQSKETGFSDKLTHQGKLLADHLRYMGYTVDELPRGITISSTILSR